MPTFPSRAIVAALAGSTLILSGCSSLSSSDHSEPVTKASVAEHYADIAHATYKDALITARNLDETVSTFLDNPTSSNLKDAQKAWLAARVPYQQSEVFRFSNPIVDNWEGQLNAWPLDEGLIDYVDRSGYQHELGNAGATANIISANRVTVGGQTVDVSEITPDLLADLNEIGGSEANVATGYHAAEFLLWGQDLNGFGAGNGDRPATDYARGDDCTHGHCQRRATYLDAVTDLLVRDLEWMVGQWAPGQPDNYRSELLAMAPDTVIQKMLFGMGSLSLGELAGERMKVALEANSYEDEHDCFSDNTHNSHYYNGLGVKNVYTGSYERINGATVTGPSLARLVQQQDPGLNNKLMTRIDHSMAELADLRQQAEADHDPMSFDMMIAPGNDKGSRVINGAIKALVLQTASIEKAASSLGINALKPDTAGHAF